RLQRARTTRSHFVSFSSLCPFFTSVARTPECPAREQGDCLFRQRAEHPGRNRAAEPSAETPNTSCIRRRPVLRNRGPLHSVFASALGLVRHPALSCDRRRRG